MKKITFILSLYFLVSGFATAQTSGINASGLRLKIFKVMASINADCSEPRTTLLEDSNPNYTDFLTNPTLGQANLADGTYNCLIITFSDNIKFTPAATSTNNFCQIGVEETRDICVSGNFTNEDGVESGCGPTENNVTMYLSTTSKASSDDDSDPLISPVSDPVNGGVNLSNPLVVNADGTATFTVKATGVVSEDSGNSNCDIDPPDFGFTL